MIFIQSPTVTMGRKYLSVPKKLDIVSAAELSRNVLGTVRVNNVQPNQIHQWRRDKEKLTENNKKTVKHSQCTVFQWLYLIWREFPNQIIKNSFKQSGFKNDLHIDIDVAVELI